MPVPVTRKSQMSGETHTIEVNTTPEKMKQWESTAPSQRPLIQKFFPELNADEREFILTGTTAEEWAELFGEEEE
jgi:hypothetical protein